MYELIMFAGTTEGYELSRFASEQGIHTCVCVATEYGRKSLTENEFLHLSDGRMDAAAMREFLRAETPKMVIDATHPYADKVTLNIREAIEGLPEEQRPKYCRVLRKRTESDDTVSTAYGKENESVSGAAYVKNMDAAANAVYVKDADSAASFLRDTAGNILLTTGSKELPSFTEQEELRGRLIARVLPLPGPLQICIEAGIEAKHIVAMQGPFSQEMNEAILRQYDCKYMVTKESGAVGGFAEKLEAACACGVTTVVIGRPFEEEGISEAECRREIISQFGLNPEPEVSIIGIGPGNKELLTEEARRELSRSDLLIGAKRIVESVRERQDAVYEYDAERIFGYIKEHNEYRRIAVVMSGDTGFYSGAKRLMGMPGIKARVLCGISSLNYFMSKICESWDDAVLLSSHGRETDLVSAAAHNHKVFSILGKSDDVSALAARLTEYGFGDVSMTVGENLSYKNEKIFTEKACRLTDYVGEALSVVLIVNDAPSVLPAVHGIPDAGFTRGDVPMTKEEVRTISLAKLGLMKDSICYDVGAGTGSVSVEMALRAENGRVYAIEKKTEALELLEKNAGKFRCGNLLVVPGEAPDALFDLPAPTHAFVGGSAGKLTGILETLIQKNPAVRIVINCITLETLNEALTALRTLCEDEPEVVQVNVSRARKVGHSHMMMGENPIYIITRKGDVRP